MWPKKAEVESLTSSGNQVESPSAKLVTTEMCLAGPGFIPKNLCRLWICPAWERKQDGVSTVTPCVHEEEQQDVVRSEERAWRLIQLFQGAVVLRKSQGRQMPLSIHDFDIFTALNASQWFCQKTPNVDWS